MNKVEQRWTKLNKDEQSLTKMNKVEQSWTKLNKVEQSWTKLNKVEQRWTKFNEKKTWKSDTITRKMFVPRAGSSTCSLRWIYENFTLFCTWFFTVLYCNCREIKDSVLHGIETEEEREYRLSEEMKALR